MTRIFPSDPVIILTLKEAQALVKLLQHQYITYTHLDERAAVDVLFKLVSESEDELAGDNSTST